MQNDLALTLWLSRSQSLSCQMRMMMRMKMRKRTTMRKMKKSLSCFSSAVGQRSPSLVSHSRQSFLSLVVRGAVHGQMMGTGLLIGHQVDPCFVTGWSLVI